MPSNTIDGGGTGRKPKSSAGKAKAWWQGSGNRTTPARTGGLMGGGPRDESRNSTDWSNDEIKYIQAAADEKINGTWGRDPNNPFGAQPDAGMPNYPGRTGTSGSGRSGGGGGGGGGSANNSAAYLAALDAMGDGGYGQLRDDSLASYKSAYDQGTAALGAANTARHAGYDTRNSTLQRLQGEGDTRLQGILAELTAGAGQARTATAGAYAKGDQDLQGLMAQYAQMAQARDGGANKTLGAFGAQGVAPSGGGVQDLLMAGRAQNSMLGTNADAMYAGRSNMYNGLNSDARTAATNQYGILQGQLAADQQAGDAQGAAAQAALAGQYAGQQQQVQLSTAQAQQQLMLQLAQARAAAVK